MYMSGNKEMITIENRREVGGECFYLLKSKRPKLTIDDFPKFNKDDYWICRMTRHQFLVNEYEDFKYSGYIFFKKDKYNKEYIDSWIEWSKYIGSIFIYLSKPFPPFPPEKIIIKK